MRKCECEEKAVSAYNRLEWDFLNKKSTIIIVTSFFLSETKLNVTLGEKRDVSYISPSFQYISRNTVFL